MISTAIVRRCTPRRDGSYGLVVRLESPQDREVMVRSAVALDAGKRVKVSGAGALWEMDPA